MAGRNAEGDDELGDRAWTAVDVWIEADLIPPDPALDATLAANTLAGLRPMEVSAAQGKFLQLLARGCRARHILEIGTLGAYSTIWLAGALPDEGRIVTIESDPLFIGVARKNILQAGLGERLESRQGSTIDMLHQLKREGARFDLIVVDHHRQPSNAYLEEVLAVARRGTMIVFNKIGRPGSLADVHPFDFHSPLAPTLFEVLAREPRISATAIQTVGRKGLDGFILAIVD